MQYHAAFTLQIAERPDIVVSYEIVYLDAAIRKLGYLSQETGVAFGNDILKLLPVVKHVTQHIDGLGLILDVVKETHQTPFLHPLMVDSP